MESPTVVEVKVGTKELDTRPLTAFLVNPHKVLGIPEHATTEHIHAAYVILLRNTRPDASMPEDQWQKCMERHTAIEAAYLRLVPWANAGLCFGFESVKFNGRDPATVSRTRCSKQATHYHERHFVIGPDPSISVRECWWRCDFHSPLDTDLWGTEQPWEEYDHTFSKKFDDTNAARNYSIVLTGTDESFMPPFVLHTVVATPPERPTRAERGVNLCQPHQK